MTCLLAGCFLLASFVGVMYCVLASASLADELSNNWGEDD